MDVPSPVIDHPLADAAWRILTVHIDPTTVNPLERALEENEE